MRRYYFIPAILGIAGLLWGADTVSAQKGGGGKGGGGGGAKGGGGGGGAKGGGGMKGGPGPGGLGRGPVNPGYNYRPYNRSGITFGFSGAPLWYDSYPYYGGSGYSYYYQPAPQYYVEPAPPIVVNSVAIHVNVPDPQAKVWFDGSPTTSTGTERVFSSPALTPGSTYSYRIRAAWIQNGKEVTQERDVPVTPGQPAVVDFTQPISEPVPAPKKQ